MVAKYELYKDVSGKFRFRLRAANNRIVVVSQAYEQHEGALNGVKSIQKNCTVGIEDLTVEGPRMNYPKYQVFTDKASEFRFRLTASNGQIIGASEGYETKESCLNGIKAMQASCDAEIEDMSVAPKPVPVMPMMEEPEPVMEEPAMAEAAVATAAAVGTAMPSATEMAEPKLELYKLPEQVAKGSVVHFKGKLSKGDSGEGIPDAYIRVLEHDMSFRLDPAWARGYTMEDGSFDLGVKVKAPHFWDDSATVYAQADGDIVKNLKSDIQKIIIK
jgi:uncharacterized protein YegP (UPF0339 family)